jgi:hypothetical protein
MGPLLLARSTVARTASRGEVNTMREINFTELEAEHVELLPSRETMNVFGSNWAGIVATNSSLALNAASLGSLANSAAVQTIVVSQS